MNRLEDIKSESPFPVGEENTTFAKYFIGKSYLSYLSEQQIGIANVTFEPGCRNHWHIHHGGGQILLCTAGRGYYQAWGQEARELHPEMSSIFRRRKSIGMGQPPTVGFLISQYPFQQKM